MDTFKDHLFLSQSESRQILIKGPFIRAKLDRLAAHFCDALVQI